MKKLLITTYLIIVLYASANALWLGEQIIKLQAMNY